MPPISETERDMQRLEAALKQLEAEHTMYFAGRLPKPPWETRSRVDAIVKHYDRAYIQNYGDRFRFSTLQSRYQTFIDLWDQGLRAREEGRPGAFGRKPNEPRSAGRADDKVMRGAQRGCFSSGRERREGELYCAGDEGFGASGNRTPGRASGRCGGD